MGFKRDFTDGKRPFGGEGNPDDVPTPTGAACAKISEIVASADEYAGEYSFGGLADTLPTAPGLFVNDVGVISLPLADAQAEKLIAKCEKSPFGYNMDTRMDENVRKSRQLQPDQEEMKHPSWQTGMDKLTEMIANRLGYKGIPLQCKLYKLLVYGEGGHFLKHQDAEKEDGMIATLVIQPPSTHEGGDLVVYRDGEVEHRHDFGKADGTAAYFFHYAVHYADAEHAVEKVTKAFRLAMVYSICLPPTMRHLNRDPNRTISDDLGSVISSMGPEDESFALLLSHHYTTKSIRDLGCGALKGVDSARFRVFQEANTRVRADKKLRFFISKLSIKIGNRFDEGGWQNYVYEQALHWYTASGENLGHWKDKRLHRKLNFLNPGHETFLQLWKSCGNPEGVFTGSEDAIRNTKYSKFAIVAWPVVRHSENVLNHIAAELAVEDLASHKPVDAAILLTFLETASANYGWEALTWGCGVKPSVRFCRSFCDLLPEARDPE